MNTTFDVIVNQFDKFGYSLKIDDNIIPDDDSTLFICAGMQKYKNDFIKADKTKKASLQSCVRTADIEEVGDGSHLTMFQMVGNFSFGNNDYDQSVEMWNRILEILKIKKLVKIHYHPTRTDHKVLWEKFGYELIPNQDCQWTDGNIGGNCCEVFVDNLEIGNLVNPIEHSVDVGFGFERLIQVVENKSRVDETSLFNSEYHPIVRDHYRCLSLFQKNNVSPGNKMREYVCRRLCRRVLQHVDILPGIEDWLISEKELRNKNIKNAKRSFRKNKDKPVLWWWDTFGILPEEMTLLRDNDERN